MSDNNKEKTEATAIAEATRSELEPQLAEMDGEESLRKVLPRLKALSEEGIRVLKATVAIVVGIGLSVERAFAEDRAAFSATFKPEVFDVAAYDDIGDRARAFWHTDIRLRQATDSSGPLQPLLAEAKPLRSKLLKSALYLWEDDPDLGDVVSSIRAGNGNANKADDLGSLATLFAEHWQLVDGQCSVTKQDLVRANELGATILMNISPSQSEEVDALQDLRNRAAEYLRRGIEDIRAGAGFIFRKRQEKMERYPSLFAGRRKKRTNGLNGGEHTSSHPAGAAAAQTEARLDVAPEATV